MKGGTFGLVPAELNTKCFLFLTHSDVTITQRHTTASCSLFQKTFFGINLKIWCHVSHQQEELTDCLWSGSVAFTLKEKFTQKWKSTKSTVGKFCSRQNVSGASHSAKQLKLETKHHVSIQLACRDHAEGVNNYIKLKLNLLKSVWDLQASVQLD